MNIINYSGGHDSTVMLHYLLHHTELEPFKVMFVDSTITLPESLEYIQNIIQLFGVENHFVLLKPKETFYERLEKYCFWPSIRALWCRRYLKMKPIRDYYASIQDPITEFLGISKNDSSFRRRKYAEPSKQRKWGKKLVNCEFPILSWTDTQKEEYMRENAIPENPIYQTMGVSGCYFCPFYHQKEFLRLKEVHPELFNRLLLAEERTGKRALPDFWLKDL